MRVLLVAGLLSLAYAGRRDRNSRPCALDGEIGQMVRLAKMPRLHGASAAMKTMQYSGTEANKACAQFCSHQSEDYAFFIMDTSGVSGECTCAQRAKKMRYARNQPAATVSIGALNTKSSKTLRKVAGRGSLSYSMCTATHGTRSAGDGSTDVILGMEDAEAGLLESASTHVLSSVHEIVDTDERRDAYHVVAGCTSASECTVSIVPAIPEPLMADLYEKAIAGAGAWRDTLANDEEVPPITVSPRKVAWFGVNFDWTKEQDDHPSMSDGDHIRMERSPSGEACPDASIPGKVRLQMMLEEMPWWKAIAYHSGEKKIAFLYEIHKSPHIVRSADLTTGASGMIELYNYVIWKSKKFGVHSPVYQITNSRALEDHEGCTFLIHYISDYVPYPGGR